MKSLLLGSPVLKVFGDGYPTPDGTCVRDYIHVEDLADAHGKGLDYLASGGAKTVLNVGTGVGSSVFDVLAAIAVVAGRPVPHEVIERRVGDPSATYADPTRAAEILGWRATHGLEHTVDTAYRWHSAQLTRRG